MEINKILGTLQHAVEGSWTQHLKTKSYNTHLILNDFYEEMLDAVDDLIEHYTGIHGDAGKFENTIEPGEDPVKYLESLRKFVDDNYKEFEESEIQSDLDDIKATIDTTLYKLKEMTESKTLSGYLIEHLG